MTGGTKTLNEIQSGFQMVVAYDQCAIFRIGEKPTVLLLSYIGSHVQRSVHATEQTTVTQEAAIQMPIPLVVTKRYEGQTLLIPTGQMNHE